MKAVTVNNTLQWHGIIYHLKRNNNSIYNILFANVFAIIFYTWTSTGGGEGPHKGGNTGRGSSGRTRAIGSVLVGGRVSISEQRMP